MHLYLHGYQCHLLKMLYSSKDIDTNSQEVDLVCLKKIKDQDTLEFHVGFILFITYILLWKCI